MMNLDRLHTGNIDAKKEQDSFPSFPSFSPLYRLPLPASFPSGATWSLKVEGKIREGNVAGERKQERKERMRRERIATKNIRIYGRQRKKE